MENFYQKKIAIVLPCYNESETIINFLQEINYVLATQSYSFLVVVVDDDSSDDTQKLLNQFNEFTDKIEFVVLSLPYNMGHQTAIHQGLIYTKKRNVDHVIIMDADGQDDPKDIRNLLSFIHSDYQIIHVVRGRRQEGYLFKILYWFYKCTFKLIVGKSMNFGNYCMISSKVLNVIASTNFIHFAAYLSKQKLKSTSILSDRRRRLHGTSKMNLNGLIHHAFKSFIEYAESFLMIFFKAFLVLMALIIFLLTYIIYQKLFTNNALLGWTSTISFILINIAIVCLGFFILGLLLLNILNQKKKTNKELYTVK